MPTRTSRCMNILVDTMVVHGKNTRSWLRCQRSLHGPRPARRWSIMRRVPIMVNWCLVTRTHMKAMTVVAAHVAQLLDTGRGCHHKPGCSNRWPSTSVQQGDSGGRARVVSCPGNTVVTPASRMLVRYALSHQRDFIYGV